MKSSHMPHSSPFAAQQDAQSRAPHSGSSKEDEAARSCEEDERHALLKELEDVTAQLRSLTAHQGIPTGHGGCRKGSRVQRLSCELSKEVEAAQRNMNQLLGKLHVSAKVLDVKLHSIQVNLQLKEAELSEADAQLKNIADALEASIKKPSYRTKNQSTAFVSTPSPSPREHHEKSKAHDDMGISADCDN
ncbi:g7605 [Coccomyxa elongata]